jgi:hypothetical protein
MTTAYDPLNPQPYELHTHDPAATATHQVVHHDHDQPQRIVEVTRPVRVGDVVRMAHRVGYAAQDAVLTTRYSGQDSPEYRAASRAWGRRLEALRRLAQALEQQGGGAS